MAIGIGTWWVSQKSQPVTIPAPNTNTIPTEPTISGTVIPPTNTDCTDELDTTCWNTYVNEEYGFSVSYPAKWVFSETKHNYQLAVLFGTLESKPGGYIWGISVDYSRDIENIISINKRGMSERENVIIGELSGTKVVSTIERYPDWKSEVIYIQFDDKVFSINSGAIKGTKFESFLSSFTVI